MHPLKQFALTDVQRYFELGTVHAINCHCEPCRCSFMKKGNSTLHTVKTDLSPECIGLPVLKHQVEMLDISIGNQIGIRQSRSLSLVLFHVFTDTALAMLVFASEAYSLFPRSMVDSDPSSVGRRWLQVREEVLGNVQPG